MNNLLKWSLIVSLGGFLFGFDTVVISGADKPLQALWGSYTLNGSNDLFHGIIVVSMALWGTVIGAFTGSIPTNKLGRKKTLFWIGILYFISALGSCLAHDPYSFAFFRFIGGLGVGASTIAAPAYVSEIAPPERRGRLVALYQFNIVFGILIAFISNYLLKDIGVNAWRWMVGVEAIPAFIFFLLVLTVPRSPRWLLTIKHNRKAAGLVLSKIDPAMDVEQEMNRIMEAEKHARSNENIFMKKYRFPLLLAFFIAAFNQLSGINAFLYYAPRIFEEASLGSEAAFLSSIGIGVTNMVFTLIGLALIDRLGRKVLMYIGSVGYIFSLGLVSASFLFGWGGLSVPIFLFMFIAAHAIGQGTVIWVFISEIFPNHLRASGQSFGSSTHWVLAAAIPALIPILFKTFTPWPVFAFFAFMMTLQLLWVMFFMPETKGKSLEELEGVLLKTKSE
jgi:sugar porter (SP) family MFS transporter